MDIISENNLFVSKDFQRFRDSQIRIEINYGSDSRHNGIFVSKVLNIHLGVTY